MSRKNKIDKVRKSNIPQKYKDQYLKDVDKIVKEKEKQIKKNKSESMNLLNESGLNYDQYVSRLSIS